MSASARNLAAKPDPSAVLTKAVARAADPRRFATDAGQPLDPTFPQRLRLRLLQHHLHSALLLVGCPG